MRNRANMIKANTTHPHIYFDIDKDISLINVTFENEGKQNFNNGAS